ncbi:LAME_0F09208g1_1 [Lachancea meyersii CBS 8951]|uniref:Copper transport protein n=1 Tax=Lachancea meyersii CBS 8951 TaxID=1266667 RepID=A0A1G4JUX2_9SACH|nr:LAME_0F09208g1_1 [Lachancea meyersii CBS 8951]
MTGKLALAYLVTALTAGVHAHAGMDDSTSSMSMSMPMSTTSSGSMSMATSSSSSSMHMHSSMSMNTYLTPSYKNYPVLFEHLKAKNKAQAFGIFVLIIAAAFAYKFLLFASWCLEVKWFKQWNPSSARKGRSAQATGPTEDNDNSSMLTAQNYTQDLEFQSQFLPKVPNLFVQIFSPSVKDLFHDLIRLLIIFCSTMLIYMLMLVTMTYVLTYVFAVILGVALAEVFFNRWKICLIARWELKRQLERKRNCKGGEICPCDGEEEGVSEPLSSASSHGSTAMEKPSAAGLVNEKAAEKQVRKSCCGRPDATNASQSADACKCDGSEAENEASKERQARELSTNTEQAGAMDVNLIPAEKFS